MDGSVHACFPHPFCPDLATGSNILMICPCQTLLVMEAADCPSQSPSARHRVQGGEQCPFLCRQVTGSRPGLGSSTWCQCSIGMQVRLSSISSISRTTHYSFGQHDIRFNPWTQRMEPCLHGGALVRMADLSRRPHPDGKSCDATLPLRRRRLSSMHYTTRRNHSLVYTRANGLPGRRGVACSSDLTLRDNASQDFPVWDLWRVYKDGWYAVLPLKHKTRLTSHHAIPHPARRRSLPRRRCHLSPHGGR